MISFFSPAALHALGFIALLFMHSFCASTVTFQFTRDICKTAPFAKPSDGRLYRAFSAFRCFKCVCKTQCSFVASARRNAHEMALSTCIHANRFSCKHEICSQECTSELYHKKKANNITLPTFQPLTTHTTDSSSQRLPLPMPFYRHCIYTFFVRSIFQVAVLCLPFS